MKKIAFVTNSSTRCGVHQYGATAFRVLLQSEKYQYVFAPTSRVNMPVRGRRPVPYDAQRARINWLNNMECDTIIYNWCPNTMGWLEEDIVQQVNKPQFLITGHEVVKIMKYITHSFNVNPVYTKRENITPLPRPLVLDHDLVYTPPGDVIKVGTFGFGQASKNFDLLVRYVNDSFPAEQQVELNMHIPNGDFIEGQRSFTQALIKKCQAEKNSNVTLNITTKFIDSTDEMIVKLNNNDINVYLYDNQTKRNTVSSILDFSLSARKPVAISNSSMFAHAHHAKDIVVNLAELQKPAGSLQNWIPAILDKGMLPLEGFYNDWAPSKFIDTIEQRIDACLN